MLDALRQAITAALTPRARKLLIAEKLGIDIETLKQFIRLEQEIGVIDTRLYLELEEKLQEISRMASGWIKYLQKEEPV